MAPLAPPVPTPLPAYPLCPPAATNFFFSDFSFIVSKDFKNSVQCLGSNSQANIRNPKRKKEKKENVITVAQPNQGAK